MSILRRPIVFIPTDTGKMVRIDPDAPTYVRLAYHEHVVREQESELRTARANEADARRAAAEVSRREARWMMIERRLRTELGKIQDKCSCLRCEFGRELLTILNSDPPVGDGFQSVKGPTPTGPSSGRPMGTETYTYTAPKTGD